MLDCDFYALNYWQASSGSVDEKGRLSSDALAGAGQWAITSPDYMEIGLPS
jgi:hypothetical protein